MTKAQKYEDCIKRYGILPILMLMEEYEKKEKYEECAIINKAIKSLKKKNIVYEELPEKISDDVIADIKGDFWSRGVKGEVAFINMNKYIEDIKKEVEL